MHHSLVPLPLYVSFSSLSTTRYLVSIFLRNNFKFQRKYPTFPSTMELTFQFLMKFLMKLCILPLFIMISVVFSSGACEQQYLHLKVKLNFHFSFASISNTDLHQFFNVSFRKITLFPLLWRIPRQVSNIVYTIALSHEKASKNNKIKQVFFIFVQIICI